METLSINEKQIAIIISCLSLFISIISTFYYTRKNNQLSTKSNLTNMVNQVYILVKERHQLLIKGIRESEAVEQISDIQLQIKNLLFEIDQFSGVEKLTQTQSRLLADTFEDFLYYDYAHKYWNKVLFSPFSSIEMEAEYYRRYAQFLYAIQDYQNGDIAFKKSLSLPNDNDGRRYINIQTYTDWATYKFKNKAELFYLQKEKERETDIPQFSDIYELLHEAYALIQEVNDYNLYRQGCHNYNAVIQHITNFTKKYCNQVAIAP